ncbi:hypothetical protein [Alteribacter lacisalsi]|uniref:hypothetical protein n=1 Tax=Alteribacter lacisalsi TaxID=2045244 RepID=UPI0013752BE1|nr:hypothetical protein [Alteribacter lacisalsi]
MNSFPDIETTPRIKAIAWYTKEINKVLIDGKGTEEYKEALLEWKNKFVKKQKR